MKYRLVTSTLAPSTAVVTETRERDFTSGDDTAKNYADIVCQEMAKRPGCEHVTTVLYKIQGHGDVDFKIYAVSVCDYQKLALAGV